MNLLDAPVAYEGFFASHFFTVSDQDNSKDFYVRILGGKAIKPGKSLPEMVCLLSTSGPLLTSNHRLAALKHTGAIEAAEDDEESERSNAARDRVSPESRNGARPALRCRQSLTSGTQFNTGLSSAVTRPDRAPYNPGDRRTAAGVSPPRQSSDIGYLDNAAGSTRVRAKPLKSWQLPAFRNERQNLGRSVH